MTTFERHRITKSTTIQDEPTPSPSESESEFESESDEEEDFERRVRLDEEEFPELEMAKKIAWELYIREKGKVKG
jgi:hypothetical protein